MPYVIRRRNPIHRAPYASCEGDYAPYKRSLREARIFSSMTDLLEYVAKHPNFQGDTLWVQEVEERVFYRPGRELK